ncbi:MAG TPA: hypothetical protein VL346_07265 [Acidobacteriaceae bacterium]|nr:hypothetical protein [Acidobacteriaceae bacterium]
MARFTVVPNGKLCPNVKSTLVEWYVDSVEDFADKYANRTTITIPNNAAKWEGHVANGTYRLDLQGAERGYGNIQAQFGKGHENCNKGGSYGGVLIVCDTPFSIADIQTALRMSLQSGGKSLVQVDIDAAPVDITPPKVKVNKASKTKPGKEPWTPGKKYY